MVTQCTHIRVFRVGQHDRYTNSKQQETLHAKLNKVKVIIADAANMIKTQDLA